ncbi:MAG: hypothetical protein QOF36_558 [Microbacteriaceae bacterium]|jgi:guanine deaminase|nr:hypothetical protein [Microbacteriaceae bacterium]
MTTQPLDQPSRNRLALVGGLIADVKARVLRRADVLVEDGTIALVAEPGALDLVNARVLDLGGSLLLPGLVNAHTHSYSMLCRHVGTGLPLEPWMMHAWSYTQGRTLDEVRLSALLHGLEALKTGTTTLLDHLGGDVANCDAALEAYQALGIRAVVAPMVSDVALPDSVGLAAEDWPAASLRHARELQPPTHDLVSAIIDLHQRWEGRSELLRVFLGPSAPQRCSRELLEKCSQASAELNMGVHLHLLETRAQAAMVPPSGEPSWVAYLGSLGLLTPRLSAAHGVWMSPAELEQAAESGVSLVHNPWSNLVLGSGIAELGAWRRLGVHAALGTDGVNCGGSMDMLVAMRLAMALHRPAQTDPDEWETIWSILALASSGGSRALGLAPGVIAEGARADISVFDTIGTEYCTEENSLASLLMSSHNHSARMVVVGGQVVVEDGRSTLIDEGALLAEAADAFAGVRKRNARLRLIAGAQEKTLLGVAMSAPPNRQVMPFIA